MYETESPKPTFGWGKALLHVMIVVFLLVALGRIFAMLDEFPNPDRIGDAGLREILLAVAFAVVGSYGLQTRQWFLLGGGIAAILVLVGLQVHAFLTFALDKSFTPAPLTLAEKRRPETLIIDDKARICHDALGFSLPHPDGFEPQIDLEDRLNKKLAKDNPNLGQWAYANSETGEAVLLIVAKDVGQTEQSFRAFAKGIRSNWENDPEIDIRDEDFKWKEGQGEYDVMTLVKDKAEMGLRCLSRAGEGEASAVVVCAETVSGEGDSLSSVRKGLHLTSCGA
jgi:hypothetical protein